MKKLVPSILVTTLILMVLSIAMYIQENEFYYRDISIKNCEITEIQPCIYDLQFVEVKIIEKLPGNPKHNSTYRHIEVYLVNTGTWNNTLINTESSLIGWKPDPMLRTDNISRFDFRIEKLTSQLLENTDWYITFYFDQGYSKILINDFSNIRFYP
jgi:hypothetical protein